MPHMRVMKFRRALLLRHPACGAHFVALLPGNLLAHYHDASMLSSGVPRNACRRVYV